MSNNILITGCKGQLGSEFKNIEQNYSQFKFFFKNRDLNILNLKALDHFVKTKKINIIINTAAYTNVNEAETNKKEADLINSNGVQNLVKVSEKNNCKLIHYSTDYVYNGVDKVPILENSKTNPINYYGKSKRKGEIFVENSFSESIIIRTSWLYSSNKNNFVNKIISKANQSKIINVVNDQFGCPTNAKDLAKDTLNILKSNLKLDYDGKIYNYSNLGSTNWNDFAKKIIEYLDIDCVVYEVSESEINSSVKRPKYSITSKEKIIKNFNLKIPSWENSLKRYLINLKIVNN